MLHRLNRAEYANAIRDLLHLDVDTATLLPPPLVGEFSFSGGILLPNYAPLKVAEIFRTLEALTPSLDWRVQSTSAPAPNSIRMPPTSSFLWPLPRC